MKTVLKNIVILAILWLIGSILSQYIKEKITYQYEETKSKNNLESLLSMETSFKQKIISAYEEQDNLWKEEPYKSVVTQYSNCVWVSFKNHMEQFALRNEQPPKGEGKVAAQNAKKICLPELNKYLK